MGPPGTPMIILWSLDTVVLTVIFMPSPMDTSKPEKAGEKVRTEMSLHVLAYNMKRMIQILGVGPLLEAIRA